MQPSGKDLYIVGDIWDDSREYLDWLMMFSALRLSSTTILFYLFILYTAGIYYKFASHGVESF